MKEILRHLLEAEELGCRAVAELEARGEELLRRATTESDSIIHNVRADTERQSGVLKRQSRTQAQQDCQAILQETDVTIERVRAEAIDRRPQAVERIVAMLLGEQLGTDSGSENTASQRVNVS
ncbi:MAG: hypothetical protein HYV60_22320 [Planctomycetia bacterium]|nr:hypothetical protein [Planctomycetia bacterium]